MKIAFILSNPVFSKSNGIVSQVFSWRKGLEQLGHEVSLISMWNKNDWKSFDVIHFFGFSVYMRDLINSICKINSNLIVSPILDPNYNTKKLKLYSYWGCNKINLTNQYHALRNVRDKIKYILVRSEFEKKYMINGFGFKDNICKVIPLSIDTSQFINVKEKENFCLHVSLLTDERKNVKRLIHASVKYKFKLVLAGKVRNEQERKLLESWIRNHENIEYKGYLSTKELFELYTKAKVFALPSLNEGVGIVALEAALMGCDIIITRLGGPKEYYNELAVKVNPKSIDSIGKSIVTMLNPKKTFQPELKNHIIENFSLKKSACNLEKIYKKLI